jgi:cobalt-zinc-cadmium resistance protein CzcA
VVVGGMFIGPVLLLVVAPALRRIFLAHDHTGEHSEAAAPAAEGGGEVATAEGKE